MKKLTNLHIDLNKVYSVMFFSIMIWIILLCILNSQYKFNPIILIGLILINVVLLCFIYKKAQVKFKKISNRSTWIFYGILTFIMVIVQSVIGYLVRTNPSWDLGIVIKAAQEILESGHATEMANYYIQASNNIFITLIFSCVIKFFQFFNIDDINIATLIVNIIFIQIAVLFLFKISKRIFNNATACFTLVLIFLFLPIYPYSTIMYTDTTSMFLPVVLLYAMIKIYDLKDSNKKYIYAIVIGILSFISLNLKVTALIVVIAFIINELVSKRFKQVFKVSGIALLTFLVLQLSYTTFLKETEIMGIPYEDTKQIPFTHFIMMGMTGTGAFSADEWQFTLKLPDYDTRKKENIRVIKERLDDYGVQGYIKFLNNKITGQTWGTGTYDFEKILNSYRVDTNIAHEFLLSTGKYYSIIFYYCQTYHFTMLLAIVLSLFYTIKKSKDDDILNISKLSILGLLIFLLFWETRSRYMLNFIPVYILVFVSGINYFYKDIGKFLLRVLYNEKKAD